MTLCDSLLDHSTLLLLHAGDQQLLVGVAAQSPLDDVPRFPFVQITVRHVHLVTQDRSAQWGQVPSHSVVICVHTKQNTNPSNW